MAVVTVVAVVAVFSSLLEGVGADADEDSFCSFCSFFFCLFNSFFDGPSRTTGSTLTSFFFSGTFVEVVGATYATPLLAF